MEGDEKQALLRAIELWLQKQKQAKSTEGGV